MVQEIRIYTGAYHTGELVRKFLHNLDDPNWEQYIKGFLHGLMAMGFNNVYATTKDGKLVYGEFDHNFDIADEDYYWTGKSYEAWNRRTSISADAADAITCPKCGSTDIMMPMVGFHERDKCLECGERF